MQNMAMAMEAARNVSRLSKKLKEATAATNLSNQKKNLFYTLALT